MRTVKQIKATIRNATKYTILEIKDTNYEHSFYGPQTDVKYECKESNQ